MGPATAGDRLPLLPGRLADVVDLPEGVRGRHPGVQGRPERPGRRTRPSAERPDRSGRGPDQPVLRCGDVADPGALRVPGEAGALGAHRPAAGRVAHRGGPGPDPCLQRQVRLVRPDPGGQRPPGRVRDAGHGHGHRLRVPAAGDPRGRARPRGHGRRAGTGRQQPGRQLVADLLAHHSARHQVGGRVRRRAEPGAVAGRVRGGQGRRRQRQRRDHHGPRPGAAEVPELRATDGLRRRVHPRRRRDHLSHRRRPVAPQGLQAEPGHRHGSHSGENMSIDVTGVTKTFGDFVALDDVTVSLPTGQLTALLGPSGGGKSTLLRIIAGLDQADTGTVTIEGREATNLPARKRNVGFVFQHYAVFKHMSVAKNVAFGLEIRKRPKDEINKRVAELLDLVHLSQFRDRMPSQLSGGQRQRMALARALAVEPTVLLLDEPFGALDAKVRKELRDWLRRLHDEVHTTTIFVTHDQEEALEVADEIVVINEGRVEQIGSPDTLYDKPANDFVMRFLGETTDLAGRTVRPHDIDVTMQPGALGATAGTVTRILRVGFEVRVTVATEDGNDVLVSMTRTLARNTGVEEGAKVWLTAAKGAISVPVMAAV